MEQINIDKKVYDKLLLIYNKLTQEDLSSNQIRRLQYLVKSKLSNDKVKLYGLINYYKQSKNPYLKVFLYNLLEQLED
jgi:hypothetical protein